MISLTPQMQDFILEHINDDTASLLLAAHRYKDIDMPWAVEQIEARRRLKSKLPEWYGNARLVMSGRVPAEQCSSEQTARYKQTLVDGCKSICDMTGGMGVDLYYMSQGMEKIIYTERNEMLCEAAKHNFYILNNEVEVRHGDGRELPIPNVDVIYLDPARRATDGSRVYAIEDCEPNVLEWQNELMLHCRKLIVKLSPMVDVTDLLRKMKNVSEVHIVAVKNECKEVLAIMHPLSEENETCKICCVDFLANKTIRFEANMPYEVNESTFYDELRSGTFIYDPDVTLVKARAFAPLCNKYGVKQLSASTHLFAANNIIEDFPGRVFKLDEIIPFSSKVLKQLRKKIPQANIATRNFPLTADELRKRTGIRDGGDVYIFATTLSGMEKIIMKSSKA